MAAIPRRLAHGNIQPTITQPTGPQQTGAVFQEELFARQVTLTPATCGYYNGIATSPVVCGSNFGSECGFFPDSTAPNFGCCSAATDGTICGFGYVSTCLNNGVRDNWNDGYGVVVDTSDKLFLCGTDTPYCSTVVLYGEDNVSYFSYACQAGSGTIATAYITADTTTSSSSSLPNDAQPRASTSATRSTRIPGSSMAHSTTTGTPGGLSQGSKVGIGVGVGVGALALLAAVIAFFVWKRRSRERRAMHPPPCYQYQPAPNIQQMETSARRGYDSGVANAYNGYEASSGRYADGSPKPLASELMEREPVELPGIDPSR